MTKILWLAPNKPENLSIGRARIAQGLRDRGYTVEYQGRNKKHIKTQLTDDYDVLIGTTSLAGIMGIESTLRRKTFIVDHVDPISQMYRTAGFKKAKLVETLENLSFRLADGILYVYDEERERLEKRNHNLTQTTLGVDYQRFQEPRSIHRGMFNRQIEYDVFAVYIGGLEEIYNIPELIRSAEYGNYNLVIAGQGSYEDMVEDADERCANIEYLGSVDHVKIPALLSLADAGICLVDDPHTVKVLEYFAAGLSTVHVEGRAQGVLPEEVHWAGIKPDEIGETVHEALESTTHPRCYEYAYNRTWKSVVNDYETMIEECL